MGNTLPIEVVDETWTSKKLGVTVMNIKSDPRRGRITTEVEELDQGEPNPSIFAPPAGYTIKEFKNSAKATGP